MPVVQPNTVVFGEAMSVWSLLIKKNTIPIYQRDYVWREKQVGQLWDDVIEHYGLYANNEDLVRPEGYFLGAMVVIAPNASHESAEVVDGQQRITSLSVMASVLYDRIDAWAVSHPAKSGLESTLRAMLGQYDSSGWVSNLSVSDSDLQQFFLESCLLKRSHADKGAYWQTPWCQERLSRKRSPFSGLKTAIEVGFAKLDAFLNLQPHPVLREKRLESLIVLITEAVICLRITATSYSSAYAIFESLNNRGIPLSQADLIKNELLKSSLPAQRDDVADNWTSARQTVESLEVISLPDFVHYSYLSRYGLVKARDLYASVKSKIISSAAAMSYSEDILVDAEALEAVTESFSGSWTSETHFMLKDIHSVLNVRLCYPYLIAAYRLDSSNPGNFEKHVEAVMNFAYRFMKILEGSVESFAAVISEACMLLRQGKNISETKALFSRNASDAEFVKEFREASVQNTKLAYFTVYYLEKAQLGGTIPSFHGVNQNLEHIMPKTPNVTHWPIALAEKNRSPDNYKDYLWRIGNILPLPASINKSIKNKNILYKISNPTGKDYTSGGHTLQSPVKVPLYLEGPQNDQWNFDSIERRQGWLADNVALRAWPL